MASRRGITNRACRFPRRWPRGLSSFTGGELRTPPMPRGDHGRPAYAQANRNLAIADVFHLLGYLGLHGKVVRYHAIGAVFGCSEDTVRKAIKTHARCWTGALPRPWECWPAPPRKSPPPR